ncbi:MAG: DJ-1/PfpI family protein [Deltaproteobacteria bacterium]|nr:DJ-1/PfpI family protein [Deltaproteobacteria bacterium]MBW2306558.1 DJ-1/PfpI family protein [Deltaproteobacteria bacterium]
MKIAFVIFEGMTALDFIGIYDPVTRLRTMDFKPDLEWEVCAYSAEVKDSTGLHFTPTRVGEPLHDYDMVIVPGGFGTRKLVEDAGFLQWLRSAEPCKFKLSVCTGSLLLGAAKFLAGKTATTHRNAFNDLRRFCPSVVDRKIVDADEIITAREVASSIDLGLYLCEKMAGREARERICRQMDYQCSL